MLNFLKKENNLTYTENGALTHSQSGNFCLDLFFKVGAMRLSDDDKISRAVIRSYVEDPEKTMKIIFYARDIRGGLGERRFFRTAIKALSGFAPEAVIRNIPYFAEYGRFDDLLTLLGTPCENNAFAEIKKQFNADTEAMNKNEPVSLLAKWLPSVNASSEETKSAGRKMAKLFGMSEKKYRQSLSALRKYIDIIENHLRTSDYTFDYSKQPSCAMFKYREAFIRNDNERYIKYLESVQKGEEKINASVLYPYEIAHECMKSDVSESKKLSLDVTWNNLPSYGSNDENAIAVIDGSGSMYCSYHSSVMPAEVAFSLGIYFAEHNKGKFANHFITFSRNPQLVEIKGKDIFEKVNYCSSFNEIANTDIEAVFKLILQTAVKNNLPQEEMPSRIYIISDMEFDYCVCNGNNAPVYDTMKKMYAKKGYRLPEVIFWNVNSSNDNIPVTMSQTGAALVSGFSPVIFDMAIAGDISPVKVMESIIFSERYAPIS